MPLEAKEISFRYGKGHWVLEDISLHVEPGEVVGLTGSSGCGKTSLARVISGYQLPDKGQVLLDGKPLAEHLLAPTKIYVKSVLKLLEQIEVHAISHITGGGFWENIPRVLPEHAKAVIDGNSWQWPAVFTWLQEHGNVATKEMYRTFNCGVGLIIALPQAVAEQAVQLLQAEGEHAWVIGHVAERVEHEEAVEIRS